MYIKKRLTKSTMALVAALATGAHGSSKSAIAAPHLASDTLQPHATQRLNRFASARSENKKIARRSTSKRKRHASSGNARASATAIVTGRSSFATVAPATQEVRAGLGWTGRSTLPAAPPRLVMTSVTTPQIGAVATPQTAAAAATRNTSGAPVATQKADHAASASDTASATNAVQVRLEDAATPTAAALRREPAGRIASTSSSAVNPRVAFALPGAASPGAPVSSAPNVSPSASSSSASAVTPPSAPGSTNAALTNVTASTPRQARSRTSQRERGPATLSSRQKDRDRLLLAQLDASLRRTQNRLDDANVELSQGQQLLASYGFALRSAMLEAGPDARGLHPFVRVAQRYAGTPYVWGGESRNGFDCSGFIMVVMRDLGYKAPPHSAAEQFNYGKPIAQALLKPGDIVFFKNTYKPGVSHVGIYLGRRRFIHAAGTGIGTIVSSLDNARFQAHYAGARRFIAAR